MDEQLRNDVSVLYGVTGDSVTPEKCITRKKIIMKSPAMSHLIKDPIPNQDINILINKNIKEFHQIEKTSSWIEIINT